MLLVLRLFTWMLIEVVKTVFGDSMPGQVCLSTIELAKGLETRRLYLTLLSNHSEGKQTSHLNTPEIVTLQFCFSSPCIYILAISSSTVSQCKTDRKYQSSFAPVARVSVFFAHHLAPAIPQPCKMIQQCFQSQFLRRKYCKLYETPSLFVHKVQNLY